MDLPFHEWSATALLRAYRRREISPVAVTQAILERIGAYNDRVNAFVRLDIEGALDAARAAERRWQQGKPMGLLDGVPVSVKDVLLTRGQPTLYGSRTVDPEQSWSIDAPAVARLRDHGAVILGKTATPEFGHKFVTDSPLTGITRNPWQPERSTGGSSGGAGAAVALGLGPLAVGTDGGGSVRIPAAWCGVVGFKPTFGRVPAYPPSAYGTLSTAGPLARTVEDAALLLNVLGQPDARDWYALPPERKDYRVGLESGMQGLRVAYHPDLGLAEVAPDIAARVGEAADVLQDLGARVEAIDDPSIAGVLEAHVVIRNSAFAHTVGQMTPDKQRLLDPSLAAMAELGRGYSAAELQGAQLVRQAVGVRMHELLGTYDLLVLPAFHAPPPPVPGLPEAWRGKAPPLTVWANHTMQPAASVPCGFTDEGLPVGLQIAAAKYRDALVLQAARAYEAARGPLPWPPLAGHA